MNDISSENLIFEIVRELTSNNTHLNKEQLYNSLSKIVVKYNISKTDNKHNECNLEYYISLFISAKQLDGLSKKNTLKNYNLHLSSFARFLKRNVEDITTMHIRNYLSDFQYLKPSSIATKVSVLKSFFGWLFEEEIIQKDPTRKIKSPKYNKHNPKYLDVDELEMLRDACESPRERSLVECLYATGSRLSEIQNMNISDIDFTNFAAKVIGKGNKERDVFFSLKAIHHLKKYLNSRNDDNNALFVSLRKPYGRLSPRGIQREIEQIAKRSPIKKKVTPHVLRHTFATLSLGNNMDISVISSILGHSDISTTQIYAHVTDENKKYQYKKYLVL